MTTTAVDAYFSAIPDPAKWAALQDLRACLQALLPEHVECVSYAMPGFRQPGPKGRVVAGYAAFSRNCGYYPHSGNIIPQFKAELAAWKTTDGAIQFTPAHPLPQDLIARLVAARRAELAT
jgi:uncharacterized protein YdhG (YjbR/CyaY superfamily)